MRHGVYRSHLEEKIIKKSILRKCGGHNEGEDEDSVKIVCMTLINLKMYLRLYNVIKD